MKFEGRKRRGGVTMGVYTEAPVTYVIGVDGEYYVFIEDDKDPKQVIKWAVDSIKNDRLIKYGRY